VDVILWLILYVDTPTSELCGHIRYTWMNLLRVNLSIEHDAPSEGS